MTQARIFVIGPFPPPVYGGAVITAAVADRLNSHDAVRRCDIAAGPMVGGLAYHLRRMRRVLAAAAAIAENAGRRGTVYVAAAGGIGLIYNLALVAVARLLRQRLFVHHHSFAYLDRPTFVMRLLTRVAGGDAVHVALCRRMEALLRARYPAVLRTICVSNAAFYPPLASASASTRQLVQPGGLRLGHMGNLTDEKGLDVVLDLYRDATAAGLAAQLVLAGPPADVHAAEEIAAAREAYGVGIDYRGPVYGADKDRFFADIDVFLFPTRYANEAEPTVLFEAMAHGVPVIAFGRGCIPEQLGDGASEASGGVVIPVDGSFVRRVGEVLRGWSAAPADFAAVQAGARARGAMLHAEGEAQLAGLLSALTGERAE
ncbi:MAG TPA: glycosyltransferase family 4 protein [Alphaproteobacteria bacterium]|jgi:glycosyltransferase involved in cell wall biosynthesis